MSLCVIALRQAPAANCEAWSSHCFTCPEVPSHRYRRSISGSVASGAAARLPSCPPPVADPLFRSMTTAVVPPYSGERYLNRSSTRACSRNRSCQRHTSPTFPRPSSCAEAHGKPLAPPDRESGTIRIVQRIEFLDAGGNRNGKAEAAPEQCTQTDCFHVSSAGRAVRIPGRDV